MSDFVLPVLGVDVSLEQRKRSKNIWPVFEKLCQLLVSAVINFYVF